ncbi:MAG: hypothetical protein OEW30_17020, partial [Acidimicrobiia bacterium]|nr:hypothetical protein [Acidimicrobiia bacterium]
MTPAPEHLHLPRRGHAHQDNGSVNVAGEAVTWLAARDTGHDGRFQVEAVLTAQTGGLGAASQGGR